ncbi:putative lipase 5 [[Candida] jaroonii]|uniref:Lipase 5 n=1 Tax=[Candida] jaroonii TaxID=467808 RepID=A0ACA9YAT2_9ASCO|nr:putative lipase 5 [[Candida] jaroonii]
MLLSTIIQFFLFTLILGAPATVQVPTDDPFYTPPSDLENYKLGDIINIRPAPAQIRSVYFTVKIKNTWQVLVRSEDSFGNANAIVTTIFEPFNADPSKLVSYQVAQDSAEVNCSPSYAFMNGLGLRTVSSQAEMFLIQTALDQGYYVVSPDFQGLKSAFTAGIQAGHAVLDSIRAALNSKDDTGINSDAATIIWGYSGGSLAGGWAAALQPNYAPELKSNLKGVALGGWVTNITATVTYEPVVNGGLFAGLGAAGIAGLSNEYPDLYEYLKTAMYEDKYEKFTQAYDQCLIDTIPTFILNNYFTGPNKYFKDGLGALTEEPIATILANNTLGLIPENMPEIPVFVYHGKIDGIVPFNQAERVYDIWCDAGISSLEFNADATAGHISEIIQGSGAAFAWIQKIFNGGSPVNGCKTTTRVSNLLYPGTDLFIGNFLNSLFNNIFGMNIGPNGENLVLQNNQLISEQNATSSA